MKGLFLLSDVLRSGIRITRQEECRSDVHDPRGCAMNGELLNVPTNSLIDMLIVILTPELATTANDGTEIQQILRELHRRGEDQHWSFGTVN